MAFAYDTCLSFPNAAAAQAAVLAAFGLSTALQYQQFLVANANTIQTDNVGGSWNAQTLAYNGKYDVNITSVNPLPAAFNPYVVVPALRKRVWA
jgi:hypothetical protein